MAKAKAAKPAAASGKGKKGAKAELVKQAPPPKVRFRRHLFPLIWGLQLLELSLSTIAPAQVEESSSEEETSSDEDVPPVVKTNGAAKVGAMVLASDQLCFCCCQHGCCRGRVEI